MRESPWTQIDLDNAAKVASSGGIIMPLSPPFYTGVGQTPGEITLVQLMEAYVAHVLALLGHPAERTWENQA